MIVTLERTVHVSPSLIESVDIRLLYITDRPQIYMPRQHQSSDAVPVAILLLLGGIQPNPGPVAAYRPLKLGVFNVHSAVHKAPLIHDVIADHHIDLLVVTETWMKSSDPPAIVNDIAPNGFYAIHRFRENDADAGGVALVHADNVQAAAVSISTTISVSMF